MTLSPLLSASGAIQLHVASVLITMAITVFILFRAKGSIQHRIAGYIWVVSMIVAAASSFWINEIRIIGAFSYIHLISVFVLVQVIVGIRHARHKNVRRHRQTMLGMVWGGLVLAGLLTFLPDRIMYQMVFTG